MSGRAPIAGGTGRFCSNGPTTDAVLHFLCTILCFHQYFVFLKSFPALEKILRRLDQICGYWSPSGGDPVFLVSWDSDTEQWQ